ncbi:hypothetical protein SNOG_04410 [Parastagonospora nodorum SN15]|uniref:Uncharacterized protein n=1 Tax=Phaeosphaeria nodorum (strain SN15 / ATCC MYA-4574 / FGSC 10173) TaxID=321614 RepID=Q0UV04_PHANO|nr:hypothetical protein SNOG_04410 [Parastagonospora nodorum SN15]EAT88170.1 hypothetical protein SNOG_04410 [Parastagonospora nodorum SN15]
MNPSTPPATPPAASETIAASLNMMMEDHTHIGA